MQFSVSKCPFLILGLDKNRISSAYFTKRTHLPFKTQFYLSAYHMHKVLVAVVHFQLLQNPHTLISI